MIKRRFLPLVAATLGIQLSTQAVADVNDIIISEYVEGSSNNKAVELLNTGSTDFTFGTEHALYFSNGQFTNQILNPSKGPLLDGITIPANGVAVFYNADAGDELKQAVQANTTNFFEAHAFESGFFNTMTFNGDDAVFLAEKSDPANARLDLIGIEGSDWGANVTLTRLKTATAPSTSYSATDWLIQASNTFTGLGIAELADEPIPVTPCTDAPDITTVSIGDIQGTGFTSPLIPEGSFQSETEYKVTGVITAVIGGLDDGFFIYSSDGNESTSDGLFVETDAPLGDELIGQEICVRGFIQEDFGFTKILATDDIWEVVNENAGVPDAIDLQRLTEDKTDGDLFRNTLERHEGMKIRLVADIDLDEEGNQDMRVSRSFSFDFDSFRNNMVLAYKRPNMQPNQDHVAGSEASAAQAAENRDFRVFIESDSRAPNGDIPYFPDFMDDPQSNYVRIDDSVIGLEGVLYYSFGEFRLIPTNQIDNSNLVHNTDRRSSPDIDSNAGESNFALRIATQNVLNFFNSPFGGAINTHGNNRGAETIEEFERQKAKLVEALYGLNADIVGLMEIENNGFGDLSAIRDLVNALNAQYTDDDYKDRNRQNSIYNQYAYVGFDSDGNTIIDDDDSIGGDAITSGLIYRPSKVSLEFAKIIPMPAQRAPIVVDANGVAITDRNDDIRENGRNFQRDAVMARFFVNHTGKRIAVAVNHFKSKGSTCWEDWEGWETWEDFDPERDDVLDLDYQGNCEDFRVAAAYQLGEEMEEIGGDRILMGDFNAYAQEDPMLVLTSNPTGKEIHAARDTFIGFRPQFGADGAVISKTYNYINAVSLKDAEKGKPSWSFSFNDEIGSLDHILISPSLSDRLIDAVDWHINAPETSLFDYSNRFKGGTDEEPNPFYAETPYRSSDHDSAIMTLRYYYWETSGEKIRVPSLGGRLEMAYHLPSDAQAGDIAKIIITPQPEDTAFNTPTIELERDGFHTVFFELVGIPRGEYEVRMRLFRDGQEVADSRRLLDVVVVSQDDLSPTITIPPNDGTGGTFGLGMIAALMSLRLLANRRAKKQL